MMRHQPDFIPCTRASNTCAGTWIFSVMLAIGGLVAAFSTRHAPHWVPLAALGVSMFGMMVFVVKYGRSCRADASHLMIPIHQPSVAAVEPSPAAAADDGGQMRRLFDRFDVRAIERARALGLAPREAASFLGFARDYVDNAHALRLLAAHDEAELERHIAASIERALLAFQAAN